jgi:hypothetical protein
MKRLPLSIWIMSLASLACLLIGFLTGHIRVWYGCGLLGIIFTIAAIGKWMQDNEPPRTPEQKEQDEIDNQTW